MNKKETTDLGGPLDIRTSYNGDFYRDFAFTEEIGGVEVPMDLTYYDAAMVIQYHDNCKIIYLWDFGNSGLVYMGAGVINVTQTLSLNRGTYEYFFTLTNANRLVVEHLRGKFIIE